MGNKISILIVIICLFPIFTLSSPQGDRLIVKEYNGLKPKLSGTGCGLRPESKMNSLEYESYDIVCKIGYIGENKSYLGEPDENGSRRIYPNWPMVYVTLYKIRDWEKSRTFVTRELLKGGPKDSNILQDKYKGRSLVLKTSSSVYKQEMYWISSEYIVYISSEDTEIPQEIIDDYKEKYPPDYTFTSEDFDIDKMIKDAMNVKFKNIYEFDDDRGWINRTFFKGDEYIGLAMQCNYEMSIRCELGMTDSEGKVDCPIAFMRDDGARKTSWKELEKEAQDRDIVIENVHWNKMDSPKCPRANQDWKLDAQKMLGMDEADMRDVEKSLMKKMGNPNP